MVFTFCVTCDIFQSQLKKFKNEYAKSNLRSKVSRPTSLHTGYESTNRNRKMVFLGKVPRRTSQTWRGMVREKKPGESRAFLKTDFYLLDLFLLFHCAQRSALTHFSAAWACGWVCRKLALSALLCAFSL
jgi:hypothetical protein